MFARTAKMLIIISPNPIKAPKSQDNIMLDLVVVIPLLAFLALSALAGGWAPLALHARSEQLLAAGGGDEARRAERVSHLCEQAASGVFFGLALLHLIPEAAEMLGRTGGDESLPIGPAAAAAAFLAALAGETARDIRRQREEDGGAGTSAGGAGGAYGALKTDDSPLLINRGPRGGQVVNGAASASASASAEARGLLAHSVMVMLAGACTHSFLEGIVLGVQKESGAFLTMFTAVALHRWAVAASLATRLRPLSFRPWVSYALVALFAFTSPAGAAAGLTVLHTAPDKVVGSCNAVAAGFFLYASVHDRPRCWPGLALYAAGVTLVGVAHAVSVD